MKTLLIFLGGFTVWMAASASEHFDLAKWQSVLAGALAWGILLTCAEARDRIVRNEQ